MPTKAEKDALSADVAEDRATTGHEWDGIREYDTPLPKWWLWIFYATIAFSLVYFVLFPSWPGITGYFGGVLDRQERRVFDARMVRAAEAQAGIRERIAAASLPEIEADQDMRGFAIAGGRTIFADNCATCHGQGGGGQRGGYPVLADDDWLWGGTLGDIEHTIRVGVRHEGLETRYSVMPNFGADGLLTPAQVSDVAHFVRSLSGGEHDAAAAERGVTIFSDNCAACHAEGGKGDALQGAPRLNDQVWLYGDTHTAIVAQVWQPQQGVMPAWDERFDEATIKMLTVYVHSLGGGQ